jgi:hypothetical protein
MEECFAVFLPPLCGWLLHGYAPNERLSVQAIGYVEFALSSFFDEPVEKAQPMSIPCCPINLATHWWEANQLACSHNRRLSLDRVVPGRDAHQ